MSFPSHAFREYDVRGVADRDLTDELAEHLGRAFASLIGPAPRIALARDCRLSSPRLHAAVTRGLLSAGAHVLDIGVGPSPLLYFAAHHLGTDGALMITGSHNPGDENGFKMMRGKAPFYGEDIRVLRDHVERSSTGVAEPVVSGGHVEHQSIEDAYVGELVSRSGFSGKLRVVLDAGNGSGGPLAVRALEAAGIEVEPLYCDMDGTFPHHHPDPTQPENLEELITRVRASGAAMGLALDGDADRLGAVDELGNIIWGDKLLLIFARSILKDHPGAAIVGEVKCSQTTYDDIAKHGGRPILWKTGHSLIKTKMKEEHALLAGEMSGHLFFADRWYGFDDATYAALRLAAIVAGSSASLSSLLADVPKTSITPELRESCPDALKFQVVARVLERYRKTHEVVDVDGARILFGNGAWGLVRASNTQPVLVLRFEAHDDATRDALRAEVEAVVRAARAELSGA